MKSEVHLHLDGSISKKTLYSLYGREKGIGFDEFEELVSIKGSVKSLADYLGKFEVPLNILQNREALEAVSCEMADELTIENYIYSEIRFAPQLHLRNGMKGEEVVSSVLKGIENRKNHNNYAGVILCIMRHLSEEEAFEIVKLAEKFYGRGVVGIDIAGDERSFPVSKFKNVFALAKNIGINFTIHAGEAQGAESVKCAIELGAKRIGHGVRCVEDMEVAKIIAQEEIMLEVCPVSNMQSSVYKEFFKEYPIKKLLDMGVKIGLNSDNRTVSDTNLKREAELLMKNFDIDEAAIKEMIRNNIKYGFADDKIIKRALKEFDNHI